MLKANERHCVLGYDIVVSEFEPWSHFWASPVGNEDHHYQVALVAQSSLSLSHHSSLSYIAPDKSSRLHLVPIKS